MRMNRALSIACVPGFTLMLIGIAVGQLPDKPYKQWTEKEAQTILNNSAWGQAQIYSDTSHMFDEGRAVVSNERREIEVPEITFRIRLFSAKPIRQATSRLVELMQKGHVNSQLAAQLDGLASAEFPDYIIVTVTVEVKKAGSLMGQAASLLDRQTTAQLQSATYLSVKGGQRVYLAEYQKPRADGLGARFVFPRMIDGKPLVASDSGELLFHSTLNGGPELSMRFKVKDMMFLGKLEY